ncbi:MAG: hypothetical protein ACOX81_01490 [Candidatus Heteroscillospira sp.]|jgi:hypothetical protein
MLITELGAATTILIGLSIGFVGFAILLFWIQLFFKNFDNNSKLFLPLFYAHMVLWTAGTCVVSAEWLNDTVEIWGKAGLIFFVVSVVLMAISKISKQR